MLVAHTKFLNVSELPAKGDYPPSSLVAALDADTGETLHLICDPDTGSRLADLDQFTDVALRLRWRKVNLASLGGSGRGNAYRLQVVGLADLKGAS